MKFNLKFKVIEVPSGLKMRCYSKHLSKFLVHFGLPQGNKMGKLKIPQIIKKNKDYLIGYIRGLFDTDGSFHRHHKKDAAVELISGYKEFLNDLALILESIKFHPSVGKKRLFLYRKEEVDRFFNLIKPANMKHLKRYKRYKNTGKI